MELAGKRLNLLAELVPDNSRIAYLSGPQFGPAGENLTNDTLEAARVLGREMIIVPSARGDYEAAFAAITKHKPAR